MKNILYLFLILPFFLLNACKDDDEKVDPNLKTLDVKTINNLNAGASGSATANHYTLFSFKTGLVVPLTDSSGTTWDLGFRGTSIIVNGGTSGPGNAGAIVKTAALDDVREADATGYTLDNGAVFAIPAGSGNGWYTYDGATNIISPIPGKVFVIRTADNKYAKFEIVSYYLDAPAVPDLSIPSRYYTFRYVYQPNGTRKVY